MNWLLALFEALKEGFKFGQDIVPSDKIREEKHEEKKELREQDFNQAKITDDYNYLKRRTEINIESYLKEVHGEVSKEYIEVVRARVHEFRYDRPIMFRKWIKENPR